MEMTTILRTLRVLTVALAFPGQATVLRAQLRCGMRLVTFLSPRKRDEK